MPQDKDKIAKALKQEATEENKTVRSVYNDAVRRAAIEMIANKGKMSAQAAQKALDTNAPAYSSYIDLAKRFVRDQMSTGKYQPISARNTSSHQ